ncbi:hypothetical protein ACFLRT_04840, partial [Acidobacteriota bacterium]
TSFSSKNAFDKANRIFYGFNRFTREADNKMAIGRSLCKLKPKRITMKKKTPFRTIIILSTFWLVKTINKGGN